MKFDKNVRSNVESMDGCIAELESTIIQFEVHISSLNVSLSNHRDPTAHDNSNNSDYDDLERPINIPINALKPIQNWGADTTLPGFGHSQRAASGPSYKLATGVTVFEEGAVDEPNPILLVANATATAHETDVASIEPRPSLVEDAQCHETDRALIENEPFLDDFASTPSDNVFATEENDSDAEPDAAKQNKHDCDPDPLRGGNQQKIRCPLCQKGFDRDCRLRQHIFVKHEGGILEKQICPFCGKNFESKYLKTHILTVHERKEVKCDACAKTFANTSALNAHRKNVHGGRRFACHNCSKSFASKYGLEVHFGKEHEIRKYACELCDSVFKSADLLRRHTKGVHEGVRHSCSTCSASYTQKSQLTYHIVLKHSVDKSDSRLVCEKCEKVFAVPYKMREHKKKCLAVLNSNMGYAHIAASLVEMNELPEKLVDE